MSVCLRTLMRRSCIHIAIFALLVSSTALAQGVALSVSSGSGSPGGTVNLSILLTSTGTAPAALQWTLGYSTVDFTSAAVTIGAAGTAAGKQVSCTNTAGSSMCLVSGLNSTTISNGVVATVALTISASTLDTSSSISLSNGVSASVDGTALTTSTTGNTVSILPVQPTWSISGTISPPSAGNGATVTLSGSANATTTANSSGNYAFTLLSNGAYTLTPSQSGYTFTPNSQTVTLNGADLPGIGFSGQVVTTDSISVDVTSSTDGSAPNNTISSPLFSTASGNELLLAFVSADYQSGANTTVSSVSGGGLTWVLVIRTNVQSGTAEIWRAFATAPLSNVSVTANLSQTVESSITVMSFAGVDTTGANGSGAIGATGTGNASQGAPTASLTTTRNNSWVFGVGNDFDNALSRTPGPSQTLTHQDLAPINDTYWVQSQSSPTPLSGTTVTINDTAPTSDRYNLSICEILPAITSGTTWSISGTISPSAGGSGATVTLSGAASATTTANSSGNYTFSGLANGSYTVTPSASGYTLSPSSQVVTVSGANVTAVNFTATPVTWSISGTISPSAGGSGATVTLSGAASATTTANASGHYTFSALVNGGYTVTPSKSGYTFSPTSQAVTVSGANASAVNFTATATPTTWIAGTISPASVGTGATLTLSGAASATTTADGSGNYMFSAVGNGAYTVTPSKSGVVFLPITQAVIMSGTNVSAVNFTALTAPGIVAPVNVSPGAGSSATQSFTFTFYDPNGYADISVVNVLVNNALSGIGACYVAFAPASATSGSLYLVDDAGDGGYASGSPISLPSSSTLHNSQCTISGTGSSVSGSGDTLTLTLAVTFASSFAGNKVIYTAARSNSQNSGWNMLGTWAVPGGAAPTGPAVGGMSPARSITTGQTYAFTFTDTNGFADVAVADMLINNSLNGIGACYVAFVPTSATSGQLYLVDDAGDGGYASGSPMALPSGGTLQNSQCTISGTGSSVAASGNTLTLNLALTFSSGFAGDQVFYLAARNNSTGNSGWQAVGSVTVP
jgi:hypothetical protein